MRIFVFILGYFFLNSCSFISKPSHSSYPHFDKVGTSAIDLLTNNRFSSLTLEIDFVTGTKPSNQALDSLTSFLGEYLNKPNGISIILDDEIPSPERSDFQLQHIKKLEKKYRDEYSTASNLAVYLLVLDGAYKKDDLDGLAYLNTSIVLFGEVIKSNYGGLGQPTIATAESAVLMHEFGHLLGLVGKGTPSQSDHLEVGKGAHCSTQGCLMASTIQTSDGNWNLSGGIIPKLDSLCFQDLSAIIGNINP